MNLAKNTQFGITLFGMSIHVELEWLCSHHNHVINLKISINVRKRSSNEFNFFFHLDIGKYDGVPREICIYVKFYVDRTD